jgi:beta-lactamase regulating signal transducer with metallopeptidase domain
VALGHELGHLLRGDQWFNLNDEWNNVLQNENPIRQQLGLPLRTAYP